MTTAPRETPPPASLDEVRRAIDAVDRDLVRALATRADLVTHALRFKRTAAEARASDRVEQVVANARRLAAELGADPDLVEHVYRAMIARFVDHELRALDQSTAPQRTERAGSEG